MKIKVNLLNSKDPYQVFLIEEEHYNDIVTFQSLYSKDIEAREAAYTFMVNPIYKTTVSIPWHVCNNIPFYPDTKTWKNLIEKYPDMKAKEYEFYVETENGQLVKASTYLGSKPSLVLSDNPINFNTPLEYEMVDAKLIELAEKNKDKKIAEYLKNPYNLALNTINEYFDAEDGQLKISYVQYFQFLVESKIENKEVNHNKALDKLYKLLQFFIKNDYIYQTLAIFKLPLTSVCEDGEGIENRIFINDIGQEIANSAPILYSTPFKKPEGWRADLDKIIYRDIFALYCSPSPKAIKMYEESTFFTNEVGKNGMKNFLNSLTSSLEIKSYYEGEEPEAIKL